MSIFFKGMKMPKYCNECVFELDGICTLNTDTTCTYEPVTRAADCPLVELPAQHGRLIDADVLNDMINRSYPMTDRVDVHNGYAICQEMIKQLPTIIEAEEEDD